MKRKWLALVLTLLLATVVLLAVFWDAVSVLAAPKLVLSKGLNEVFSQLESRFSGSPVHLLSDAIDPEGRQEVRFCLDTSTDLLGVVRYDMTLHTQGVPARLLAEGSVITGSRKLDLKLFLNDTFGAVSSDTLVGSSYFGITYDSFAEDIRSNPMLGYLIGAQTIQKWEESIRTIQSTMSRSYAFPEFAAEDIRSALFGVMALKAKVGREEVHLAGQMQKVHTVTFRSSGPEIAAAAGPYGDQLSPELRELLASLKNDPNASVEVVFFLHKGSVVRIDGTMERKGSSTRLTANLGAAPATDPLTLETEIKEEENLSRLHLSLETTPGEDAYAETLRLTRTANAVREHTVLEYHWDLETGEMKLSVLRNDVKTDLRLNLQAAEDGLRLTTNDFEALLGIFTGKQRERAAICTMTIAPGGPVEIPEYRAFDTWSMEDMLNLLSGLGGLLGLKIG